MVGFWVLVFGLVLFFNWVRGEMWSALFQGLKYNQLELNTMPMGKSQHIILSNKNKIQNRIGKSL